MRHRNPRGTSVMLVVLVLVLVTPQLAMASFVKLSGAMPAFGDVIGFRISPDGRYVVYWADQDTDDVRELYSVPLAGGTPVRLNGALPTGSSVWSFQISPDSSRVIYAAPQDAMGIRELYSVPIAGPAGAGVKLNGELVAGGQVGGYQISPDSSRVVYRADQQTNGVDELYSVPITGAPSDGVKLNGLLVDGGFVWSFKISPDSSRVVYRADQQTNGVYELYSVPITGAPSDGVKLNGLLVDGGFVWSFKISPDSSRVVYIADQQTNGVDELYSVPLDGPASAGVKLNEMLVDGGIVVDFEISPDSGRVVYRADQQTDGVYELYSVPITGAPSDGVKLNGALVEGGDVHFDDGCVLISKDSSRVVYLADQQTNDVYELYSVPLAGPARAGVKLNRTLADGGKVYPGDFRISPDSNRVIYKAPQDTTGIWELYSVPIAGPASDGVKLNGTLVDNGKLWSFQVSPDGSRVVYLADQQTDGVYELYSVPLAEPASVGVKLNGFLVDTDDLSKVDFKISPDSDRVVYFADQQTDDVFELYVADDGQTQVVFDAPAASVAEDAGIKSLAVELTGAAVLPVSVEYAVTGGTATGGGVDYALADGSLTFDPGETSQTIEVTIVDDALDEGDETVVLTLSDPQNATIGTVASTTLTIQGHQEVRVGFGATAATVAEDAGIKSLAVELTGAAVLPISVKYAVTGGTATGGGVDYALADGSLNFDPGQTSQTIEVTVVDDALDEADETVVLALGKPQNVILGSVDSTTLTIQDNDYAAYLPMVLRGGEQ